MCKLNVLKLQVWFECVKRRGETIIAVSPLLLAVTMVSIIPVACADEKSDIGSHTEESNTKAVQLPEAVVAALESNAQAITTCTILSVAERDYRKDPGKQSPTRIQREEITKYFDDGRRVYHQGITTVKRRDGSTKKRTNEISFDGHVFYVGTPFTDRHSTLLKLMGENPDGEGVNNRILQDPYLDAAGFFFPQTPREWATKSLSALVLEHARSGHVVDFSMTPESATIQLAIPDRIVLAAKEMDVAKQVQEWKTTDTDPGFIDREVSVIEHLKQLEPTRRITFSLDPSKQFAVLHRSETTPDGKQILSAHSSDFKFYKEKSIWLPSRCVIRYYSIPDTLTSISETPYQTTTVRLKEVSFKRRDDVTFALDYSKPGTLIGDRSSLAARDTASGQVNFTVAADGTVLREAARSVGLNESRRTLFIAANLIVCAILAAIYIGVRIRSS